MHWQKNNYQRVTIKLFPAGNENTKGQHLVAGCLSCIMNFNQDLARKREAETQSMKRNACAEETDVRACGHRKLDQRIRERARTSGSPRIHSRGTNLTTASLPWKLKAGRHFRAKIKAVLTALFRMNMTPYKDHAWVNTCKHVSAIHHLSKNTTHQKVTFIRNQRCAFICVCV